MTDTAIALRLMIVLPVVFLVSYVIVDAIVALLAPIALYLLGAVAIIVVLIFGMFLLAAWVS